MRFRSFYDQNFYRLLVAHTLFILALLSAAVLN